MAVFDDYAIQTGYTQEGMAWAAINEFFALSAIARTHEEAIRKLRTDYSRRVKSMEAEGRPLPKPGSNAERARFAKHDRMDTLRPVAEAFWRDILGTSLETSFISDESTLSSWEHYGGGRAVLIERTRQRYGVDIAEVYDLPIPDVLERLRGRAG